MPIKDYSSYKNTWLAEKEARKNVVPEIQGPPGPPQGYQPPPAEEPTRSLFSVPFSVLDMPGEEPMPTEKPLEQAQQWKQQNPFLRALGLVTQGNIASRTVEKVLGPDKMRVEPTSEAEKRLESAGAFAYDDPGLESGLFF